MGKDKDIEKIGKFTGIVNWFDVGIKKESVQQEITDCIVAKNTDEDFERINFQVAHFNEYLACEVHGYLKNEAFTGTLSYTMSKKDEKLYDIPGDEGLSGTYVSSENLITIKGKGMNKTENEYQFHITLNKFRITIKNVH